VVGFRDFAQKWVRFCIYPFRNLDNNRFAPFVRADYSAANEEELSLADV
jgi:hypothetical protein